MITGYQIQSDLSSVILPPFINHISLGSYTTLHYQEIYVNGYQPMLNPP